MGVGMSARIAVLLTRWWTRLYTLGLPTEVRAARCDEIESDLWESLHDPQARHPQILSRLAAGIADDICWRGMHVPDEARTMGLTMVTAVLMLAAMWQWLARPTITTMIAESVWIYPVAESSHVLAIALFLGLTVML